MRNIPDLFLQDERTFYRATFFLSVALLKVCEVFRAIELNKVARQYESSADPLHDQDERDHKKNINQRYLAIELFFAIIGVGSFVMTCHLLPERRNQLPEQQPHPQPQLRPQINANANVQPDFAFIGKAWGAAFGLASFSSGLVYEHYLEYQATQACKIAQCPDADLSLELKKIRNNAKLTYRTFILIALAGGLTFKYWDDNPEKAPLLLTRAAHFIKLEKPRRARRDIHLQ